MKNDGRPQHVRGFPLASGSRPPRYPAPTAKAHNSNATFTAKDRRRTLVQPPAAPRQVQITVKRYRKIVVDE